MAFLPQTIFGALATAPKKEVKAGATPTTQPQGGQTPQQPPAQPTTQNSQTTLDELLAGAAADGTLSINEAFVPPLLPEYIKLSDEELAALVPLSMFSQGFDPSVLGTAEGAIIQERIMRNLRIQSNLTALDTYGKLLDTRRALDERTNALFADVAEDLRTVLSSQNLQFVVSEIIKNWKTRNPNRSWNKLAVNVRMNEIRSLMRNPQAFPALTHLYQRWQNLKTRLEQRKAMLPPQDRDRVSHLETELGNSFEDFIMRYLIVDDPEEAEMERYNRLMQYMSAQQQALGLSSPNVPMVGQPTATSGFPQFSFTGYRGSPTGGAPQQGGQPLTILDIEKPFNDLLNKSFQVKNGVLQLNEFSQGFGRTAISDLGDFKTILGFVAGSGLLPQDPALANEVLNLLRGGRTINSLIFEANEFLKKGDLTSQEKGMALWNIALLLGTAHIAKQHGLPPFQENRSLWAEVVPRIVEFTADQLRTKTIAGRRAGETLGQPQETNTRIYQITRQSPQQIWQLFGQRTAFVVNQPVQPNEVGVRPPDLPNYERVLRFDIDAPLFNALQQIANTTSGLYGNRTPEATQTVRQGAQNVIGLLMRHHGANINRGLRSLLERMQEQGERSKQFGERDFGIVLMPRYKTNAQNQRIMAGGTVVIYMSKPKPRPQQRPQQGRGGGR